MVDNIRPGMCHNGMCPPPDRIECIVVDKVYDSCFQVDSRTRTTNVTVGSGGQLSVGTFNAADVGTVVKCQITPGRDISCTEVSRTPAGDGFVTVTVLVSVPITLTNPKDTSANPQTVSRVFTFTKMATLCCPEGVSPDCSESTLLFCNCVISAFNSTSIEITCDFEVCLVLKCILTVQLLVPSYGFCVPAPCSTIAGVCPPLPPSQCF